MGWVCYFDKVTLLLSPLVADIDPESRRPVRLVPAFNVHDFFNVMYR